MLMGEGIVTASSTVRWEGQPTNIALKCMINECVCVYERTNAEAIFEPRKTLQCLFLIGCFNSSFDNSQICSCSSDKTVILWDVATGQVTRKLRGHAGVSSAVYNSL